MKHTLLTSLGWKWGLCLLITLASCNGRANSSKTSQPAETTDSLTFQLPEIPTVYTEVEERLNYLILHYWDNFEFRDTNYIHVPEVTEQALVNYIDLLGHSEAQVADSAVTTLLASASVEPLMLDYFIETSRRYLYDPNSPMRNEDLYTVWAGAVSKSEAVNLTYQMKAQHDLKMMTLNRPGELATDFVYTLRDGRSMKLSQLKAEHILLLFYDPDCDRCQLVLAQMLKSSLLAVKCSSGEVTVLTVYGDGDEEVWKNSNGKIPSWWVDSYDRNHVIIDRELYDLSAMPSLYLLDADKRVVLKDAPWEQILRWLEQEE